MTDKGSINKIVLCPEYHIKSVLSLNRHGRELKSNNGLKTNELFDVRWVKSCLLAIGRMRGS